jgi:hypothetical protein
MGTPSIVKVFIFSIRKCERLAGGQSALKGIIAFSFAYGNKNSFICCFCAQVLVFLPLTRIIIAPNLKFIIKKLFEIYKEDATRRR